MTDNFGLVVSVSADEWAYTRRRLAYLEAVLVRIVRDRANIQEWFSAGELAAKRLPGLPENKAGITRRATQDRWRKRKVQGARRWHYAYHVSSLPGRTFDALIARVLDLPPLDGVISVVPDLPDMPAPLPAMPENTAPPWVLPLVRLLRTETGGNLGEAWDRLPDFLPPGIELPDVDEAVRVLIRFGIAGRG